MSSTYHSIMCLLYFILGIVSGIIGVVHKDGALIALAVALLAWAEIHGIRADMEES